jgi:hypothetical protein
MKRIGAIVGLFCVAMGAAQPARAGYWSWLEEFSGPGPFTSKTPPLFATVCKTDRDERSWTLGVPGTREEGTPRVCVFADFQRMSAPGSRGFPEVGLTWFDAGAAYPIANGLFEIGAGLGTMRFTNDETGSATRVVATPIRFVSRPFHFIRHFDPSNRRLARWSNVFKVYFKETAVLGELTAQDFGVTNPQNPAFGFRTNGEMVRSYGLVIDLTEVISAVGP